MKRILCISGSRADAGLLEWPVKVLREAFKVDLFELAADNPAQAFSQAEHALTDKMYGMPDCLLILGDRWEILQAAIAAHLQRVPIAHIGGGDVTRGSYDDAMRDCISMLSKWHFPTSGPASAILESWRYENVHMVGNIAMDFIMHGDWKQQARFCPGPYVVVSYQAETIDGAIDWDAVVDAIAGRPVYFMRPNKDAGSDKINALIDEYIGDSDTAISWMRHDAFLSLLYHADEFIGNSSAMLYEAPALGVKCRMIGRRQEGRVAPTGDGRASERIKEVLCRVL